jgi:hypothetical protein
MRVSCPACAVVQEHRLFESLNGDRVPAQVRRILEGTFELIECTACAAPFRPEHRMLFSHLSRRAWIVMFPLVEREEFAILERGVTLTLERNFGAAPPVVAEQVSGLRPRIVFGQHMLSDAVRAVDAGLDPALLEAAKLFAFRRHLAQLMPHGPTELCFEGFAPADDGRLRFGVHRLRDGRRVDALALPADAIAEVRAGQDDVERELPDLFQPYASASRYLYGT